MTEGDTRKILHAPFNIAGTPAALAAAQRKLGFYADSYSMDNAVYGFPVDISLKKPGSRFEMLRNAHKFGKKYDVFQFYFGGSLTATHLKDVEGLYKKGKTLCFYFCGCDVRDEKHTSLNYPVSACRVCFPKLCSANREQALEYAAKYGAASFVSTPDLLEYVRDSILVPQPVFFDRIERLQQTPPPARDAADDTFYVAHAPTNRVMKGTDYLLQAVKDMRRDGRNIKLILVENLPHEQALQAYRQADLALDQLMVGAYGLTTAELMALGVPVMVYLRDSLIPLYAEKPPVINTNIRTLRETLEYYYQNRGKLKEFGPKGREYARRVHHPEVLARQCLRYY